MDGQTSRQTSLSSMRRGPSCRAGQGGFEGVTQGFAVVDVETTGFSATTERIVEIAVVVVDPDGAEVEAFCTVLDPGRDPGPTHIHGITSEMIDGAPGFGEIHQYVASLLTGRVLVGHNVARFDLRFLEEECRRLGGDGLIPAEPPTIIDTLSIARDLLGMYGKASLLDCCEHFGLTWDDHHSALGDARITSELLVKMRSALGDEVIGVRERLQGASSIVWPGGAPIRPVIRLRAGSFGSGSEHAAAGLPASAVQGELDLEQRDG
jgi:DNA polymerase III epsilon subunit family exonuclease